MSRPVTNVLCPSLAYASLLAAWLIAADHFASYLLSDHGPIVMTDAPLPEIGHAIRTTEGR